METGHEIISTAVLSLPLIQVGLYAATGKKMSTKYWLTAKESLSRNRMVRLIEHLDISIVVDWDVNQHSNKQSNKQKKARLLLQKQTVLSDRDRKMTTYEILLAYL